MNTITRTGVSLLSLAAVTVSMLEGQEVLSVRTDPACRSCEITATRIVTLGDDSMALVGATPTLQRDSRGRYYMTRDFDMAEILVLGADGDYITTLGRPGKGPGEYVAVNSIIVGAGDTIHVIDAGARRHTVLSPSYDVLRTTPIAYAPETNGVILLPNQKLLVHALSADPSAFGVPFHVLDSTGKVIRSFGGTNAQLDWESLVPLTMRMIAPSTRAGLFWAIRWRRYEPELWDARNGELSKVLQREYRWFREELTAPQVTPPSAEMHGIWEDSKDRLWVIVWIPDQNWRKVRAAVGPDGEYYAACDRSRVYDSSVAIFDSRTGRLIATDTFDAAFIPMRRGYFYSCRETDDGSPRIDVWQLELATPTRGGNR